ncbi:hypothetical protein NLJ89_g5568 [Agrocybe chaxingu]|uniref:Uncharacterized protein n=1 Tax=Agrocybe chaxingu TaxID=84603 RepID=A0A9W8JZZ6_9AGAR|nr:hypothetical protein NLJ89_g5568 [Agrocybe chaxingu]
MHGIPTLRWRLQLAHALADDALCSASQRDAFRLRRKADTASQEPLLSNEGEDDGLRDGPSRARLAGNPSNSDGETHSEDLSSVGRGSMDGAHAEEGASEEPNENASVRKARRADSGAGGYETHESKELHPRGEFIVELRSRYLYFGARINVPP